MPTIPSIPHVDGLRRVLLFSGHRIDAPGRLTPRFPPAAQGLAATAIDAALGTLGAGAEDLALTQGAAGGDILFAEACLRRGVRLVLMQPLPEAQFVDASVASSVDGPHWVGRYAAVAARAAQPPRTLASNDAADVPADAFTRCNQWMVDSAAALGVPLQLVCLWDGSDGDGPGGTAHMVRAVSDRGGKVTWIDTRTLW